MKKILLFVAIILVSILLVWQLFLRDMQLSGKASITWNASTDSSVTGYKIYYGTQKRTGNCPQGGYTKKIDAGKNTSYQLGNLKDGATYYFSVTSVNSSGKESCFSPEMSKTVKISILDKLKALL